MTRTLAARVEGVRELGLRTIPAVTAVGGIGLLVAMQIPWLEGPIAKVGISNSEAFRTTMIAVVLTAISGQLYELSLLARATAAAERRHFRDTVDMYGFLSERISTVEQGGDRRADVLVAHLAGVLHYMSVIVQRPEFTGWVIRIAAMTAPYGRSNPFVADELLAGARRNVRVLRDLAESQEIRGRGNRVEVYEYDVPPVLYGVKLGNGDLFICLMRWREDGFLNGFAGRFWQYIPRTEDTRDAESMRHLFDTWFERVLQDSAPQGGEASSPRPMSERHGPVR
jgi:hypothetical protein